MFVLFCKAETIPLIIWVIQFLEIVFLPRNFAKNRTSAHFSSQNVICAAQCSHSIFSYKGRRRVPTKCPKTTETVNSLVTVQCIHAVLSLMLLRCSTETQNTNSIVAYRYLFMFSLQNIYYITDLQWDLFWLKLHVLIIVGT